MFHSWKNSLRNLQRNKVRAFLTSLGILIGVASVVLLVAFGVGLQDLIRKQFDSLGSNLIVVLPGNLAGEGGFQDSEGGFGSVTYSEQDIQLLKRLKSAVHVGGAHVTTARIEAAGETEVADVYSINAEMIPIRKLEPEHGVFFTETDVKKRSKKAILGPKIAEELYGSPQSSINKTIRIEGQRFTVTGTFKAKGTGSLGGPDVDSFIFVPYTAAVSWNPKQTFVTIIAQAPSDESITQLKDDMYQVLLKNHDADDFSLVEQTEILELITGIFAVLNSILVAIGSIALVVGGVGIMNIMYASVSERVKEIGIRRAVGATRADILSQFLIESVTLSVIGGTLGLLLSVIVVLIANRWIPARITLISPVIAIFVSSAIGIFFGVFPARKASRLTPIEAIRK